MRNRVDSNEDTRGAIVELLCDELEKGISIKVACDLVGITNAAYYRWRRKAEEGDDEAIQIMRRLATARARGFEQHVGKIKATADQTDDWRARAWLVDKLYPNWVGRIEEIEYTLAEQQDGKAVEWSTPERLLALVMYAVESGLVPIDQLLAIAPKQAVRPSVEQPEQDPLEAIRAAVVDQLADGPRELTELRDVVCALTGCTSEELEHACDGLDLEQLISQGSKPMVRLADTARIPSRTTPTSEVPESSQVRERPAGNFLDPPGSQGVGDFIARRRGR
jgi:transposase-like protein